MQLQHGLFKLNPILLSLGLLAVPGLAQAESVKANETVVVTATQTSYTRADRPGQRLRGHRADLDKMNVNNIGDALKHVPVSTSSAPTHGSQRDQDPRHGGDYTLLLVNGKRVNARETLGSSLWQRLRLKLHPHGRHRAHRGIRGPVSSLYGADALGGVVNVILRQAKENTEAAVGYTHHAHQRGWQGCQPG